MGNSCKKALITGASRGIGRGIALCLAAEGYDLAISYRSEKKEADAVKRKIEETYGHKCFIFQASLEEEGASVKLVEQAIEALGGLDLMVSNAGVTKLCNFLDMEEADIDRLIKIDFKNYLLLCKSAARHMVENKVTGNIIFITSSRGQRAYPDDAVYGGIKSGLNRAVESIALDLAPYGIRVNCIAPGAIRIRGEKEIAGLNANLPEGFKIPTDFWDRLGERIPLGRSGLPEDIGNAVAFLASEKASYITGVTLRVDGGLILPGMPELTDPTGADLGWGFVPKK